MTELKETNAHSNVEEFAEDFIEMLQNSDDSLIYTHGLMLTSGNYQIHIFAEEEIEDANSSLILLARSRLDLLEGSLEAENFHEFITGTRDLAKWLQLRGLTVGISGSTFWTNLRIKLLNWFPFGV